MHTHGYHAVLHKQGHVHLDAKTHSFFAVREMRAVTYRSWHARAKTIPIEKSSVIVWVVQQEPFTAKREQAIIIRRVRRENPPFPPRNVSSFRQTHGADQ
jgi:hypothetical protein